MNRRSFLQSILALACAPAIVRAESLMPIRALVRPIVLSPLPLPATLYGGAVGGGMSDHMLYGGARGGKSGLMLALINERMRQVEQDIKAQLNEALWNYDSKSGLLEPSTPYRAAMPGQRTLIVGSVRDRISLSAPDASGRGQKLVWTVTEIPIRSQPIALGIAPKAPTSIGSRASQGRSWWRKG